MLCAVIKGPSFADITKQIHKLPAGVDLVELRLDYFSDINFSLLQNLRTQFFIPMIFTLRKQSQGGAFIGSEQSRLNKIRLFAKLEPEYLDLEWDVDPSIINEITNLYPNIKIIISYHNFEETPKDLDLIYKHMKKSPAFIYKIAAKANDQSDALRLLEFTKGSNGKINTMSMGMEEEPTRVLGPIFGCSMTYAGSEEGSKLVKGQFSAIKLLDVYHFSSLSKTTKVYGLIGDPVDASISHYTHNHLFEALRINAVYVKIPIHPEKRLLDKFLKYAKKLGFSGLSVTMPLKEVVLPSLDYLDPIAEQIGAVNTLLFDENDIYGFNTDGPGALNAIEEMIPVKGKKIIIIGAGGAAKAIAYEACRRGGSVIVLNRHPQKALQISQHFSFYAIEHGGLNNMKDYYEKGYDILIACTPASMPIDPNFIHPQAVVMDINTRPKTTELLQMAQQKGCQIVCGYKMFIEQALGQFSIWFKNRIDISYARKIIADKINQINF